MAPTPDEPGIDADYVERPRSIGRRIANWGCTACIRPQERFFSRLSRTTGAGWARVLFAAWRAFQIWAFIVLSALGSLAVGMALAAALPGAGFYAPFVAGMALGFTLVSAAATFTFGKPHGVFWLEDALTRQFGGRA